MKIQLKDLYFPSVVILIQGILTIHSYIQYEKYINEIIALKLSITPIFYNGLNLLYAVIIISAFQFFVKLKFFNPLAKYLLVTLLFVQLWNFIVPTVPYDAIINTAIFSAVLAVIISIIMLIRHFALKYLFKTKV